MSAVRGKQKELEKAKKLFRRRKYTETIRLLEPQIFAYRENPLFYHYLGVSCLRNGDFAGAYSYLKRSEQLEPGKIGSRLALAVVHLKRQNIQESLRLWLEVLEEEPSNRYAQRGLDTVRAGSLEDAEMERFFQTGSHQRLIPREGLGMGRFLKIITLVLLLFLVGGGLWQLSRLVPKKEPSPLRPEIAGIQIQQGEGILDPGEKAPFMLTEQEIRESFDNIKGLFDQFRDNEARREINRLLLSNARREVKDKAALFIPHIRTPSFADFNGPFTFQEVSAQPEVYEGCFVRWKGRISNLVISEKEIRFDFLVGYQDQKVLEGIVSARLGFATSMDPAFAYELIGKLVLRKTEGFDLDVISIHKMGL